MARGYPLRLLRICSGYFAFAVLVADLPNGVIRPSEEFDHFAFALSVGDSMGDFEEGCDGLDFEPAVGEGIVDYLGFAARIDHYSDVALHGVVPTRVTKDNDVARSKIFF